MSEQTDRPSRPGAWQATVFGLVGFGLMVLGQALAVGLLIELTTSPSDGDGAARMESLVEGMSPGAPLVSLSFLISTPLVVLFALACTRRLRDPLGYLGFRHMAAFLPILPWLVGLLVAYQGLSLALDVFLARRIVPPFLETIHATAEGIWLPLIWLSVCVLAPLAEEILYRGLVLPAWARSWLGPSGASVAISMLWAISHVQYRLSYMIEIFVLGLVLSWLRLRYRSLAPCLALHASNNALAMTISAFVLSGSAT
ncbi:MAG TPA: CPBP family glutamic-type intramembrane protease [Myxococcota bacterium]|nr:CPBP family glutamic-type intramembrane protease [Myxococcota bacterium]